MLLYNGFVWRHLEYAIQVWSPYLRKDIDRLERVQRKASKLVKGFKKLSYEEHLDRLNLTTLEKRRMRGDLIETYKLLTGRENIDFNCFFHLDDSRYNTRGHQYKLKKQWLHLDIQKNFFSNWVVSECNSLHAHTIEDDTVITFKNRLNSCRRWGN